MTALLFVIKSTGRRRPVLFVILIILIPTHR